MSGLFPFSLAQRHVRSSRRVPSHRRAGNQRDQRGLASRQFHCTLGMCAYSHQIPHLFRFKPYHLFRFKTYRAFRSQSPVNAQGKMFEQRYSLSSDQLYALSRTTW